MNPLRCSAVFGASRTRCHLPRWHRGRHEGIVAAPLLNLAAVSLYGYTGGQVYAPCLIDWPRSPTRRFLRRLRRQREERLRRANARGSDTLPETIPEGMRGQPPLAVTLGNPNVGRGIPDGWPDYPGPWAKG